jgi:hypothetical protein
MKIEKGIPIPPKGSQRYPFTEMGVGDSVFIADKTSGTIHPMLSHLRRKGKLFSARHWEEDGVFGVRVWRVK